MWVSRIPGAAVPCARRGGRSGGVCHDRSADPLQEPQRGCTRNTPGGAMLCLFVFLHLSFRLAVEIACNIKCCALLFFSCVLHPLRLATERPYMRFMSRYSALPIVLVYCDFSIGKQFCCRKSHREAVAAMRIRALCAAMSFCFSCSFVHHCSAAFDRHLFYLCRVLFEILTHYSQQALHV